MSMVNYYNNFNKLRYLYRLVLKLRNISREEGLLYCRFLLIRSNWQRKSKPIEYLTFDSDFEITVAKAIASGVLMEDWVAEQVASGYTDSQSLRTLWIRTATIITTYLTRAKEIDYQVDEDMGEIKSNIQLEF